MFAQFRVRVFYASYVPRLTDIVNHHRTTQHARARAILIFVLGGLKCDRVSASVACVFVHERQEMVEKLLARAIIIVESHAEQGKITCVHVLNSLRGLSGNECRLPIM